MPAWIRYGAALAVVLATAGWQPFHSPDPDVEAGNAAYAAGRYDDALAAYDRAARRGAVDPDGLAYDRGTAVLKKAESTKDPDEKRRLTERALEDLKQARNAKDPQVRAAASYNRGNTLMGQDKLDEAIEAYKDALRDNSEFDDARLNLELALRRRQNQQRQQQGQGQGQGQPGQPDRGGGDQQGQGQNQGPSPPPSGGGQGNPPPASGSGQPTPPPPGGGSGQGSNAPSTPPPGGRPQRQRGGPRLPKTPSDTKLDDLDEFSRRLQKDEARRRATGRSSDPQRDW